jgi:GDPmannose 4,6-dehydratase
LLGDPRKAKKRLGWVPEISVNEMCAEMMGEDLKKAKNISFLNTHIDES